MNEVVAVAGMLDLSFFVTCATESGWDTFEKLV